VPAKNIHLYDLRLKLRTAPPGTTVFFKVLNAAGKTRDVLIILRDLI